MIDPDRHPALVVGDVIDPVGDRLAELWVFEVVGADLDRLAGRAPLTPAVLEVADQLLLLGVDRYHRLAGGHRARDRGVYVLELRVAVGMLAPLADLRGGLQAVYGNEGRIRLQTLDRQSTQAAALGLVSSAIVTWNTHHMNEIIERERDAGRSLDDVDLARLSAALHAHINLNGRYHIDPDQPPRHLTPGRDSLATYQ